MGRRDPGAADQVTRLSGCSLTRAAGAGSFERFSASFRDKLREKLARPDAAVPLREAGSLPSFSARRLLSRATAAAALRALRRARFFRASAAGSATMGGSGGLRFGNVASMASRAHHRPWRARTWRALASMASRWCGPSSQQKEEGGRRPFSETLGRKGRRAAHSRRRRFYHQETVSSPHEARRTSAWPSPSMSTGRASHAQFLDVVSVCKVHDCASLTPGT